MSQRKQKTILDFNPQDPYEREGFKSAALENGVDPLLVEGMLREIQLRKEARTNLENRSVDYNSPEAAQPNTLGAANQVDTSQYQREAPRQTQVPLNQTRQPDQGMNAVQRRLYQQDADEQQRQNSMAQYNALLQQRRLESSGLQVGPGGSIKETHGPVGMDRSEAIPSARERNPGAVNLPHSESIPASPKAAPSQAPSAPAQPEPPQAVNISQPTVQSSPAPSPAAQEQTPAAQTAAPSVASAPEQPAAPAPEFQNSASNVGLPSQPAAPAPMTADAARNFRSPSVGPNAQSMFDVPTTQPAAPLQSDLAQAPGTPVKPDLTRMGKPAPQPGLTGVQRPADLTRLGKPVAQTQPNTPQGPVGDLGVLAQRRATNAYNQQADRSQMTTEELRTLARRANPSANTMAAAPAKKPFFRLADGLAPKLAPHPLGMTNPFKANPNPAGNTTGLNSNPAIKSGSENFIEEEFNKGIVFEFSKYQEKQASLDKQAEEEYLLHLRSELRKMAAVIEDCPYSDADIVQITSSAENFEKAAHAEAVEVWSGIVQELKKQGASEDFIQGLEKEAGVIGNLFKLAPAIAKNFGAATSAIKNMAGATQRAANTFGKSHALVDAAGNILSHAPTAEKIRGAKRLSAIGDFMANAKGLSGETRDILRGMQTNLASGIKKQYVDQANHVLQSHIGDLSDTARFGSGAAARNAQKQLNEISKGNNTNLAKSLNVAPVQLNKVSPEVMGDVRSYATDARKARFDPGQVDSFTGMMDPAVAKGKPASNVGFTGPLDRMTNGWFRFSPSKALSSAGKGLVAGATVGSVVPGVGTGVGAGVGTALGALHGGLGTGGTIAALGYGGNKLGKGLGLWGGDPNKLDNTGMPEDRNRALPMINNNWAGGIGGALIGSLLANQQGLTGPAAWLMPLMAALAGHHYFPQLMNRWKDPYGLGANRINPNAAAFNQNYMLGQR